MKFPASLMAVVLLGETLAFGQTGFPRPQIGFQPPQYVRTPPEAMGAVLLARTCESGPGAEFGQCMRTMMGLWLGIDASESLKDNRSICFPPLANYPIDDIRKAFIKYVAANPKKVDDHLGHVAYRAFLEAYPCKK
jgi:hypothetical protein